MARPEAPVCQSLRSPYTEAREHRTRRGGRPPSRPRAGAAGYAEVGPTSGSGRSGGVPQRDVEFRAAAGGRWARRHRRAAGRFIPRTPTEQRARRASGRGRHSMAMSLNELEFDVIRGGKKKTEQAATTGVFGPKGGGRPSLKCLLRLLNGMQPACQRQIGLQRSTRASRPQRRPGGSAYFRAVVRIIPHSSGPPSQATRAASP